MTTATLTLSDFLLARIAEDEEVARAATQGPWRIAEQDLTEVRSVEAVQQDESPLSDVLAHVASGVWPEEAAHIARHDPARVLAECDAKRRMFVALASAHAASEVWLTRGRDEILAITDQALRLMALPYAEHPDYREEWRV